MPDRYDDDENEATIIRGNGEEVAQDTSDEFDILVDEDEDGDDAVSLSLDEDDIELLDDDDLELVDEGRDGMDSPVGSRERA